MRDQLTDAVQADQEAGLRKWVEYLGGEDGGYPDWFKYYAWNSVIKLGDFDKDKQQFQKRSKGTTAPYPELNREALAYVYDNLNNFRVEGNSPEGLNDAKLQEHLKSANFGKLYAHAVLEATSVTPELRNEIRGSWTKFNQNHDPRVARRLAESIQGHGTGWCTAGESTAANQLEQGDFYVYYTRDEEGNDTVPRVAIRMQNNQVAEVRGVNTAQELEPELYDVTLEQLHELPGGETYIRKAEDMKRLTEIDKKVHSESSVLLSADELKFLYEIDHRIIGFGYDKDPRVEEIKSTRNFLEDMFSVFNTADQDVVAEGLIQHLRGDLVFNNFDLFSEVDQQFVADKMIESPNEFNNFIHNLDKFHGLNEETALVVAAQSEAALKKIANNLGSFKELGKTVADLILESDSIITPDRTVLQNLDRFKPGAINQKALTERILDTPSGLTVIAGSIDKLEEGVVDHEQLAHKMIDNYNGQALAWNLEKFNVDVEGVATHLIMTGQASDIARNFEKFESVFGDKKTFRKLSKIVETMIPDEIDIAGSVFNKMMKYRYAVSPVKQIKNRKHRKSK